MDNLNCKMQAHARVCEENKLKLEKKRLLRTPIETILRLYKKNGKAYQDDILKDDSP